NRGGEPPGFQNLTFTHIPRVWEGTRLCQARTSRCTHALPTVMRGHGRPGGRVRGVRRSASGYESPRWGDAIEMGPGELVLSGDDPDDAVDSRPQRPVSSF